MPRCSDLAPRSPQDAARLLQPSAPQQTAAHGPWLSYLCLASSMALVGGYVGLSKLLLVVFPVFLLAWLRFGIAAVAMAGWVRRGAGEAPLGARGRRLVFLESFFGNFLFSVCMLFGMSMTSAVSAGIIMAAIPAVVAVLSWAFLHERIAPRVAAGIVCAVGGIALVSLAKEGAGAPSSSQAATFWGNVLLLGAVTCEALYVVIGKKLSGGVSPRRISALINLWGLVLVTPLGLWQAARFDFHAVAPGPWLLLGFYSLAASMVAVWLWMTGLRRVPASSAGVFTVLLPVSAALVGILFLGERIHAMQVAAFALALSGVMLATWPQHSTAGAAASDAAREREKPRSST